MDFTALREIAILKELNNVNIVKIIDMFYGANSLYLAYEYIDKDLSHIIYSKDIVMTEGGIKGLMKQFLNGLAEIHKYNVIHRDLKPQHLLLSKKGVLKIADFGFSRFIASPNRKMTVGVISNWYRPPEIFFGTQYYSYSIDIWSAGCIFAEFLMKSPIFYTPHQDIRGEKEILTKIFYLLGVPNEFTWPGVAQLNLFKVFSPGDVETIDAKFANYSVEARDLLEKMLVLDPNKRITAEEALDHPYFTVEPLPSTYEEIEKIINL